VVARLVVPANSPLVTEVRAGRLYLRAEAMFSAFDYRVGDQRVHRTAATAAMTQHLRAYGGSGVIGGQPVVRVPPGRLQSPFSPLSC
jgi:hypothetical protein